MGDFTNIPAHTELSVQQFLNKNGMTPVTHPPYSPNPNMSNILIIFPDDKSPQRETFCRCGRGEKKIAEVLKVIKIEEFKNCFDQWKYVLLGVLHQMESSLKATEV